MQILITEADRRHMRAEAVAVARQQYPAMPRWFKVAMADHLVRQWVADAETKGVVE